VTNKNLRSFFQTFISLLELHQANSFKIRGYQSLLFTIDKCSKTLSDLSHEERIEIEGISKSSSEKIEEILKTGTFTEYQKYLDTTPQGVIEILNIKGLGAKKVLTIWKELGVESKEELKLACEEKKIADLKGFGAKTQQKIIDSLAFEKAQIGKFLLAEIEEYAAHLKESLCNWLDSSHVALVGQCERKYPVINKLDFLISGYSYNELKTSLKDKLEYDLLESISQPKILKIQVKEPFIEVHLHICSPKEWVTQKLILSSGPGHLQHRIEKQSVKSKILLSEAETEVDFYKDNQLPYTSPETREGLVEFSANFDNEKLIQDNQLLGILHNHSTYSDGKNTLREMAEYCQELGYEYLGISDHSVSAFYANGLDADRITTQQLEIDKLNKEMAPFKIFKGIESDILNDGSLDYPDDVLKSFDFIVSSIHSNLTMDKEKATQRLITAIENPYTTILGHMTGRLLLRRDGYPIDHKKVIDACAANNVVIEINANPWRLDIDWTWIDYALSQNVMLSINPDAHETHGYHCMKYGVYMGRKAGMTSKKCLNSLTREEIETYFNSRKA